MAIDQAASLRNRGLGAAGAVLTLPTPPRQRVLAISGGKGGVGKSTIAVNLACTFAASGSRTLAFDGDLGMADLNLLLGVAPGKTLLDLLEGAPAAEVLVKAHNLELLPALYGSSALANLDARRRAALRERITELTQAFHTTIIDTGAGLGHDTMQLAAGARDVIVVATPEPLSLADAYACLKVLSLQHGVQRALLLPNNVRSEAEAQNISMQLGKLVDRFLDLEVITLPHVPHDPALREAALDGMPVVLARPDGPTARALKRVARALDTLAASAPSLPPPARRSLPSPPPAAAAKASASAPSHALERDPDTMAWVPERVALAPDVSAESAATLHFAQRASLPVHAAQSRDTQTEELAPPRRPHTSPAALGQVARTPQVSEAAARAPTLSAPPAPPSRAPVAPRARDVVPRTSSPLHLPDTSDLSMPSLAPRAAAATESAAHLTADLDAPAPARAPYRPHPTSPRRSEEPR